jgi:hypothetical protein
LALALCVLGAISAPARALGAVDRHSVHCQVVIGSNSRDAYGGNGGALYLTLYSSTSVNITSNQGFNHVYGVGNGQQVFISFYSSGTFQVFAVDTRTGDHCAGSPIAFSTGIVEGNQSGYVLDLFGGVHAFGLAPDVGTLGGPAPPYWSNWDIARAMAVYYAPENYNNHCVTPQCHQPRGGWTLDGWGGIHEWGAAPYIPTTAYWSGWDIARDLVVLPDGHRAYVLDGYGGIHPTGGAPPLGGYVYWAGSDLARSLLITVDAQGNPTGGCTLDLYGGKHPFMAATYYDCGAAVPYITRDIWRRLRGVAGFLFPGITTFARYNAFDSPVPVFNYPNWWGTWDAIRDIVPARVF